MDDHGGLVDALVQTAFETIAATARVADEFGLSVPQLRVLGILRDRRVRMSDLASYLGLEKSSLSGLIERAEKRGLVTRERSTLDGRSVEVSLTPLGEDLARQAATRTQRLILPIVDALNDRERSDLRSLLEKALASRSSHPGTTSMPRP